MPLQGEPVKRFRVRPDERVVLIDHDARDSGDYRSEAAAVERTEHLRQQLALLQERLYAEGTRSLLIVLQGIDTSGKDGTIRHVMGGINPQGCAVTSFKEPTPLEASHDFLWRVHAACPAGGRIGLFNRSHYEDVLVPRLSGAIQGKEIQRRFDRIREFEKALAEGGTRVLKFALHISKAEQKKRLLERLDDADKRWKFRAQDLEDRGRWEDYHQAFQEAISATSTAEAPWYVIPADHKWYRNLIVAEHLVHALEKMDPQPPKAHALDWGAIRQQVEQA